MEPGESAPNPGDEVDEELGDFAEHSEEWPSDPQDPQVELAGADAQCFDLLTQLQAREKADKVEWDDIERGEADLNDHDDARAQRLGSGTCLPSQELMDLDAEDWKAVTKPEPKKDGMDDQMSSDILTLSDVFRKARLGDAELVRVSGLTPFIWECLRNLRESSDQYCLAQPRKFRTGHQGKKLNWYQASEKECAAIRSICGHPAKRTSRAAAWRALAASMRKTVGVDNETGDLAAGMVVLYAPIGIQEWKLGLVLTVWRSTAKQGAKPTALPIPADAAKAFRVCDLTHAHNSQDGTYTAGADSNSVVCPIYRLGMALRVKDGGTKKGIDGIRIVLGAKEMEVVDAVKKWTVWNVGNDVRIRKRKASTKDSNGSNGKPTVVLIDDDDDDDDDDEGNDACAAGAPSKKVKKTTDASEAEAAANSSGKSSKITMKLLELEFEAVCGSVWGLNPRV